MTTASPSTLSANRTGAAWMVVSMTAFTVNDAFMKALGQDCPLFQAIFVRGLGVVALLLVLAAALGQMRFRAAPGDWPRILIRAGCEAGGAWLFLSAVFEMPLAEATAIIQTLPLTVTLAGALFLGEPVGWRRMSAIALGFVGVLLIVKPGGDFDANALKVLGAVGLITLREIVSRGMSAGVPSLFAALISAVGVAALGGFGSLTETWAPFDARASWLVAGAVVTVGVAYVASVVTVRQGDLGFVAPYRYTGLVVALIVGVIVFAERPDALTLVGAALIVGTGLFTLYRERADG
ncbi:MAG: DMT family transporter [Shimia sp.]